SMRQGALRSLWCWLPIASGVLVTGLTALAQTQPAKKEAVLPGKQLTRDGRQCMDPVFIRGGAELVFTVLESPTQTSLMRLKLAAGTADRLHPQATTAEFEAAFSPDGRYCAFVQSRANLNLKLILRDTQLNKDAVFDPGGGFAGMRRPSIAPDA